MQVKGSFEGASAVDCTASATQCGLQSVNSANFADRSQDATVLLAFGPKSPPAPDGPTLTLSKSKVKVGDTVTLTGTKLPQDGQVAVRVDLR